MGQPHAAQRVGADRIYRAVRDRGDRGIIVASYFNPLLETGLDRVPAVLRAAEVRLRPVMFSCPVARVGSLPAAISRGTGLQVPKPLVLVGGGIVLAPILILVILPVLIDVFSWPRSCDVHAGAPEPAE